jgi:ubiquinol-cytochrome c reductase cytochrome b subunit
MARVEAEVGKPQGGFMKWVDERFPFTKTMKQHVTEYYAAKNFNFWYVFGVLATVVLVIQLLTGIFLTMNYKPSA